MTGFVGKCAKQSFSVTVFAHSPFKHGLCAHLPEANGGIVNVDINLLRLKPTQNKREIVSMISLTSEQRFKKCSCKGKYETKKYQCKTSLVLRHGRKQSLSQ
jgi:hypothetical protein